MQTKELAGQGSMFGPDSVYGKMCPESTAAEQRPARTSARSSRRSFGLKNHTLMLLDLRPGGGNMLGPCWEYDPVWLGRYGELNTSECPKGAVESSLSQILQDSVPSRYYLSRRACLGILRRAEERGKTLPPQLELALKMQAGIIRPPPGMTASEFLWAAANEMGAFGRPVAFAANQRDEVRDLHDLSAALSAQSGMKQQTFIAQECLTPWDTQQSRIFTPEGTAPTLASADGGGGRNPGGLVYTAGFSATAGSKAGSIGFQEEIAPTLKGTPSGGMMPSVLCLNDQGGSIMSCTEDVAGTLRAQEHGHQPLIFENHGIDARYKGPLSVAPTMSARMGTGGNNTGLVLQEPEAICISGNAIDRQPQNGGNGIGFQMELAYTLTATDHHAVFARQRVDKFQESDVVSTESARQHKDATDLICQPTYQDTVGPLTRSDYKGPNSQYVGQDKLIVVGPLLIRRLIPPECELLQGYPPGWTDLPGASDSARYKSLGNSVAVPCVEYLMQGIALVLRAGL